MNNPILDSKPGFDLNWDEPKWPVSGEWPEGPAIDDEAFARAIAEGRRQEVA